MKINYDKPDGTGFDKKRKWATDIINKNIKNIHYHRFNRILRCSYVQLSDGRIGFSKCSKDDVFNSVIGKAVAICRATGEKIPDFI